MNYKTERNIQATIQLELSKSGVVVFRNNIGSYTSESGHRINYGVGGPGGSDLIGIAPTVITQDMVGQTIGVFTAIEVKNRQGRVSENQQKFIDSVLRYGGFAGVARSPGAALKITKREANEN